MRDDHNKVIITRRGLAVTALRRWRDRGRLYVPNRYDLDPVGIEMELEALGENPDPAAVDKILGKSWTREECSVCGETGEGPWVGLGWDPDYDCPEVTVCVGCLRSAVALIDTKET